MIVNYINEVKACRLLPRVIGQEVLFFSALPIYRFSLCVSISLSGIEQNGKIDI